MNRHFFNAFAKTILAAGLLLALSHGAQGQTSPVLAKPVKGSISFKETQKDLGILKESDSVQVSYSFINTGKAAFEIEKAEGSCGCTRTTATHGPIAPGKGGQVQVTFTAKGLIGNISRPVVVTSTATNPRKVLQFNTWVLGPNEEDLSKVVSVKVPKEGMTVAMAQRGQIEIEVLNHSTDTLSFANQHSYCRCTAYEFVQGTRALPGKPFKLRLAYWPPAPGARQEKIYLQFEGKRAGVVPVILPVKVTGA